MAKFALLVELKGKPDSGQTSSCEDARRPARKVARTQKTVARLGRRVLTVHVDFLRLRTRPRARTGTPL